MASDSDNDNFDEDYSMIDHQIDLFESRQSIKSSKTKQKVRKPKCPITARTLKSSPKLIKSKCTNYSQTPKAEPKPFRYVRYTKEPTFFECDRQFQVIEQEPISSSVLQTEKKSVTQNNSSQLKSQINSLKKLEVEHLASFSSFRHHFYNLIHLSIKSSLENQSFIQIADIRPCILYHGTKVDNIKGILNYGLLIPGQPHPAISEAPCITSRNGQSYGRGIYSSLTVSTSLCYTRETNTVLICAALPKRRGPHAALDHCHGDILVLREESKIIPLFLFDFKYLRGIQANYPWFEYEKKFPLKEKKEVIRTGVISRKYLRKVLARMNDETRKADLYQIRQYESMN